MATTTKNDNSTSVKKHPNRHYYSFYTSKFRKKEILALVKLGIAPNVSQFLKNALEIHIDKYRHLIRPEIMDVVEKEFFTELQKSSTNLNEV